MISISKLNYNTVLKPKKTTFQAIIPFMENFVFCCFENLQE